MDDANLPQFHVMQRGSHWYVKGENIEIEMGPFDGWLDATNAAHAFVVDYFDRMQCAGISAELVEDDNG